MKKNGFIFVVMLGVMLGLGLMGCVSTKYVRSDPLGAEQKGDYAVLRMRNTLSKKGRPFAKIDGVLLESNEILLPAETTEHDVKFIVKDWTSFVIQANIPLPMEAGKTYLLTVDLTPGSRAARLISFLLPAKFQFELYEYSSDLKNRTQLGVFDVVEISTDEF